MGSRDLQSSLRDERRTFRYGTNRMMDIALQHELDDVAKKSLDEIVVKKELELQKPLENEEYTSRRLRPAFAPQRKTKKNKSEPVFHDDLLKMKPKVPQFQLIPNIPPYNPLDRFGQPKDMDDRIRTYPYTRENTITTEGMRQARVTSLGVLPNRKSGDVSDLKVVMEGRPVVEARDSLLEIEEANMVRTETPGTPDELDIALEPDYEDEVPKKKPAILGSEGTTTRVSLAVRPPKQAPRSTLKRRHRVKSSRSIADSLKSEEIVLPDEKVYEKYADAIAEMDKDLENVQTAVGEQSQAELKIPTGLADDEGRKSGALSEAAKSVQDMLEEAKKIASPGAEPVFRTRKSPRKKEVKKEGKKKDKGHKKKDDESKDGGPRTERTVDEIIASLRSQSRAGQQTEADRKIQEIMDRVMSRSSGVVNRVRKSGQETVQLPLVPPSTAQKLPLVEPLALGDSESEGEEVIDIDKAWEEYRMPNVTHEDLVGITGKQAMLEGRHPPLPGFKSFETPVHSDSVSFLSAWKPVGDKREREEDVEEEKRPSKSVHHFCTVTREYQLPDEFLNVGRKYHTPSRFQFAMPDQQYRFGSGGPARPGVSPVEEGSEERRMSAVARRVLEKVAEEESGADQSLETWKQRAEQVFERDPEKVLVHGKPAYSQYNESRLYWAPAPPKLDVAPAKRPTAGVQSQELQEVMEESSSSEEELEEPEITEEDREQMEQMERLLLRKHGSHEDLTTLVKASRTRDEDIKAGRLFPYEERILTDSEREREELNLKQAAGMGDRESSFVQPKRELSMSDLLPAFVPWRRSKSAPDLAEEEDDTLMVAQDYNSAMEEIARQKANIREWKMQRKLEQQQAELEQNAENMEVEEEETIDQLQKKKTKSSVSMARLDDIETFLKKRPRKLKRAESMIRIPKPIEKELRVPARIREGSRRSMPDIFNFNEYARRKGKRKNADLREWTRDIWNNWFDEVYPPTPEDSDYEEEEELTEEQIAEREEAEKMKKRKDSLSSAVPEGMEYIEPITETDETLEVHQILMEEIEKLTGEMDKVSKPSAFDYSRRGALYRKIGYLKAAETDLSKAIQLEPLLLDAYWHRHLLLVLQDRKKEALEDLTFILKHTKNHSGAYRSMAEIYQKQDDITMAIVNYTQAIKLNPRDHEAFFARAECYEKRGDMLLALEDYSACTKIAPHRIDAILKHGMYYFENKSWNNAINDFTDLLRVDPLNASARVLRGRSYAAMGQWSPAVEDLSAAIHLDPGHWQAFYHRACILRKAHPKRALHDYSVSLLIKDSEENISSYLHRGILYNAMGRPDDAIPDFESVLKLNKDSACAHVNLGLIMMNHHDNYHRAIKRFSSAIKVDPTYVRAYVCRGEAYHKIHELKLALRDFTRAIHLRPDVNHYYMYRGQLLLELGQLDLAAFCVKHASEISNDVSMGQRPTQQAVVHSFLKNYDKAIDALMLSTRSNPKPSMYMLLGKTQMKAKKFKVAVDSFNLALSLYKPWRARDPWPIEAADTHYLIGQCHMELANYPQALDSFTDAIKLNTNMAEALYQRGMARMKLKMGALKYHIKAYDLAIRDLSKAASIESTCALAYFNRAVCYQENRDYQKALTDYGIVLLLGDSLKLKVLINRGLLYFEKKDYQNALYDFKLSANISTHDHKILHTLGLCYHKLGQLEEAVRTFTLCIRNQPFFLDGTIARGNPALEGRSIINLQMSDTFAAFQDINVAVKVNPTAELLTNRGVIHQFMDDRVNAMRDYHAAMELDPTYALAYFNAGNALDYYKKAVTHNPKDESAFLNRAITKVMLKDSKGALEDFRAAIKLSPFSAHMYLNRGNLYASTQQYELAEKDYTKALDLQPDDPMVLKRRADVRGKLSKKEEAISDYRQAIELQGRIQYLKTGK
ncbi:TTC6-like protein [Mya arenaria]|uniref:TTC6-like protein n=1 Tax=Mya arenaria TaxID=6604 RepID=A0ABY7DSF0_MYAAR|nr:TTC6-like protein [Mya arenaria]